MKFTAFLPAISKDALKRISAQVRSWCDRAFIGTADEFEIQVRSLDGTLRERWSRPTGDLSFDDDDFEALFAEEPSDFQQGRAIDFLRLGIDEAERAGRSEEAESALREALPDTLPAYSRFLVDATDHLWVEHYRYLARDPHVWSIFTPDGTWLGEVEVPGTFDVTDIGRDYVLGVYRDELDEQSVRLYRLIRDTRCEDSASNHVWRFLC